MCFFFASTSPRLERPESILVLPKCRLQKDAFFLLTPEALVCRILPQSIQYYKILIVLEDTSCILAWLIEEGYEVHAFMADVGQEEVRLNTSL